MRIVTPEKEQWDRQRWLIVPELWNLEDHRRASREAWFIDCSNIPGKTRIKHIPYLTIPIRSIDGPSLPQVMCGFTIQYDARDPNLAPFVGDLQAAEWVLEQVHQGSEFHERAWRAVVKAQMMGSLAEGENHG